VGEFDLAIGDQVFAVPHPNKGARERDVYPAFQFEDGKPIKAVQGVLEAFAGGLVSKPTDRYRELAAGVAGHAFHPAMG